MTFAIQQGIAGLLLYASLAQGTLTALPSQTGQMAVTTAKELIAATQNKKVTEINVSADLADLSPLTLMPGQTLRSVLGRHAVLSFRPEADGLQVTTDNFGTIGNAEFDRIVTHGTEPWVFRSANPSESRLCSVASRHSEEPVHRCPWDSADREFWKRRKFAHSRS